MKYKILLSVLACLSVLLLSPRPTVAQQNPPTPPTPPVAPAPPWSNVVDPTTGMPGGVDPQTGLPRQVEWIADNWTEPSLIVSNFNCDGLPLSEVARSLREQFTNAFDIIVPESWTAPSGEVISVCDRTVKCQLRNVDAGGLFHGMNLVFDAQNAPFRWQLIMNGSRPMVLLRVIPALLLRATHPLDPSTGLPQGMKPPAEPKRPVVFYVGDLIGAEESVAQKMDEIYNTVLDVVKNADIGDLDIKINSGAELVIVKGTTEQIAFVRSTLEAFKQKAEYTRFLKNAHAGEPRTGDGGGANK